MKPIEFKGCNAVYAKDQPEYFPLPCHKSPDGTVTSCWKLSFRERLRVMLKGKFYLQILTFNKPLQPVKMTVYLRIQTDEDVFDEAFDKATGPSSYPKSENHKPVG